MRKAVPAPDPGQARRPARAARRSTWARTRPAAPPGRPARTPRRSRSARSRTACPSRRTAQAARLAPASGSAARQRAAPSRPSGSWGSRPASCSISARLAAPSTVSLSRICQRSRASRSGPPGTRPAASQDHRAENVVRARRAVDQPPHGDQPQLVAVAGRMRAEQVPAQGGDVRQRGVALPRRQVAVGDRPAGVADHVRRRWSSRSRRAGAGPPGRGTAAARALRPGPGRGRRSRRPRG